MDTPTTQPSSTPNGDSSKPSDREVKVFLPYSSSWSPSNIELPDSIYEPTLADLKTTVNEIEEKNQYNSILRTKAERERDRLNKLSKFQKVLMRVRFPDRVELQGTFLPTEGPAELYAFVKESLAHNHPFYLFTTPPRKKLPNDKKKNFLDLSFVPATLVHFSWESNQEVQTYLKPSLLELQEEKHPVLDPLLPPPNNSVPPSAAPEPKPKTATTSNKTPAWFLQGKKI
eukprot:TRINITY_DN15529_c0_g1_i1.p1 TRINITY_DN15529_c0_g1~~TRINITY_DN15529_c0_g1_i1.p1  ORF type:complete len:240 (+),score=52.52 TRINITY_DN15529_c0_g1_i1:36-722(+)